MTHKMAYTGYVQKAKQLRLYEENHKAFFFCCLKSEEYGQSKTFGC